ncbi:MAG: hypothetical protein P4L40_14395 [Terracidiphilus sp.]|nr:hypothetical protein [Terracidiphilus sp.]
MRVYVCVCVCIPASLRACIFAWFVCAVRFIPTKPHPGRLHSYILSLVCCCIMCDARCALLEMCSGQWGH